MVFTALYVVVLGYITWMYLSEFIQCAEPNVYEATTNNFLKEDEPENDLANLFPVISFLDYSRPRPWPKGLPAVPFSDIKCHFGVKFSHNTGNSWLLNPAPPIPLIGNCNEKFKEMYKKKTGKDDETFSKTRYLMCPDIPNLPLVGDGTACQGSGPCGYYSFMMVKHFGSTAHCNPINYDSLILFISYINPKLTVDDYQNPWSYEIESEWTSFSQTQSQMLIINHFITTLETDSRSFGFSPRSKTEKKLVWNPVSRINKTAFLSHGRNPYIRVL